MKELTLESVTTVFIDGKSYTAANLGEMFDMLNIPNTEEYHEARCDIVAKLIAFHEADLSPAYPGHSVKVTWELK